MAAITQATEASQADEGKKVFVGNLPFEATDQELRDIFAGQGEITEAQIIKKYARGSRSLGYGFVTFATSQAAAAAISALDQSDYNGRSINVQLAKPSTKTPRGDVAREAAQAAGGEATTDGFETTGGRGGRGRGRGGRGRSSRGRGRGGRQIAADGEADGVTDITNQLDQTHVNGSGEETRGRGGRGRGRGAARVRRGPPTGESSKTQLFIANLPFNLDNDGLKKIFEGYKIKDAHVVVRKFGPVTGRSKGFGFVDCEDEHEQRKVLEHFNGFQIEGREMQVKIAIESAEGDANQPAQESEAPAA